LGLCSGCCDNLISLSEYNENIEDVRKFLKGKNFDALKELKSKMQEYAINREFESAAEVRDQIQELMYVQQKIRVAYGEDEKEVQFKKEKEAFSTVKDLFEKLGIKEYSENLRMECYDVSNIQGTNPITSMVVFEKGLQKLSDYRYFNIRKKSTPDDFHMMEEALERRMKYLKQANLRDDKSFSSKPDLIIVDGGKGQLGIALDVVSKFNLDINVVGIAKREEEIIQKKESSYKIYRLRKDSKVLHLVQNIRDEAHRFAITRHRNLRGKKALESVLTQIPGVGSKTIENLIKNFGSIDAIRSANFEELNSVLENKSKCAEIIKFFK
jgi:excinuclease ABC subunit C